LIERNAEEMDLRRHQLIEGVAVYATNMLESKLGQAVKPEVKGFLDKETSTISYVVRDPASNCAAILDSVLDIDYAAGRLLSRRQTESSLMHCRTVSRSKG
jgi:hypothetical protein